MKRIGGLLTTTNVKEVDPSWATPNPQKIGPWSGSDMRTWSWCRVPDLGHEVDMKRQIWAMKLMQSPRSGPWIWKKSQIWDMNLIVRPRV